MKRALKKEKKVNAQLYAQKRAPKNLQFVAADVRGLEGLPVCLGGGGVTVAAPHGAELRAELSVPAPVSHPKHY